MQGPIYVVAAAIQHEGRILVTQRATGPLAGLWEFPGGKVEPGEPPEDALAREICEELSCIVEVGSIVATNRHNYEFATIDLSVYWCTIIDGSPQLREHSAVRWLLPAELASVRWAAADLPAVEAIRSASSA